MSRIFAGLTGTPYLGAYNGAAIDLCGMTPGENPQVIPLIIPWNLYSAGSAKPTASVAVNLQNATTGQSLFSRVRSVYIDNLGCNVPVYIYFPDTNFTVAAAPNSTGWYPVTTNGIVALIIGQGFTNADLNSITNVSFCNMQVPPFANAELAQNVALYRSSPAIQRGNTIYNSLYAPPALGDQADNNTLSLTFPGTVQLFGGPKASGFYYLTSVFIDIFGVSNLAAAIDTLFIESTGVSGLLYQFGFVAPDSTIGPTNYIAFLYLAQMTGLQLKLDATQNWRVRNQASISNGTANINLCYTYQP
jgi:hypothetical protein